MNKLKLLCSVLAVGLGSAVFAEEATVVNNTVAIPGGLNIGELIGSCVGVLGGIVAIAIVAWCGFLLVKKALKWVSKAVS